MKSNQEKSKEYYSKLSSGKADKTTIAGRYSFDEGKEQYIVNDIILKLKLNEKVTFFDIGCGGGFVTESLIKYIVANNSSATLMDIDEIIDGIRENFITQTELDSPRLKLIKGYFPQDYKINELKFDRILLYSVLHYTDDPFMIVNEAVKLLNPNGELLLGDLPNISQKGRFLSSEKGKIFEAEYKKTTIENIPVYKDHCDFVSKMKSDPNYYSLIDDTFVYKIYQTYTQQGFDVFILPQPDQLPFSKTRHDILIRRHA